MRQRLFQFVGELVASAFPNSGRKQGRQFDRVQTGSLELFARANGVFGDRIAAQRQLRVGFQRVSAARSAALKSALEVELRIATIHLMPRRFLSTSAVSSASRNAISSGLTVIATPKRAPSMRNECTPDARRLSVPTGAIL